MFSHYKKTLEENTNDKGFYWSSFIRIRIFRIKPHRIRQTRGYGDIRSVLWSETLMFILIRCCIRKVPKYWFSPSLCTSGSSSPFIKILKSHPCFYFRKLSHTHTPPHSPTTTPPSYTHVLPTPQHHVFTTITSQDGT